MGPWDSENKKVRDRIESKRHKIQKNNQNTISLPHNVVYFPERPNQEKILDLCEDLFKERPKGLES